MAAADFAVLDSVSLPVMEPFGLLESLPAEVVEEAKRWCDHLVAGFPGAVQAVRADLVVFRDERGRELLDLPDALTRPTWCGPPPFARSSTGSRRGSATGSRPASWPTTSTNWKTSSSRPGTRPG